MTLTVVRERFGNTAVKAAEVIVEGQQIRIKTDTKVLLGLIKAIIPIPAMVKTREGDKVFKTQPKDANENLYITLKQNLYDPYRLAREDEKTLEGFKQEYEEIVTLSLLRGEDRHLVMENTP